MSYSTPFNSKVNFIDINQNLNDSYDSALEKNAEEQLLAAMKESENDRTELNSPTFGRVNRFRNHTLKSPLISKTVASKGTHLDSQKSNLLIKDMNFHDDNVEYIENESDGEYYYNEYNNDEDEYIGEDEMNEDHNPYSQYDKDIDEYNGENETNEDQNSYSQYDEDINELNKKYTALQFYMSQFLKDQLQDEDEGEFIETNNYFENRQNLYEEEGEFMENEELFNELNEDYGEYSQVEYSNEYETNGKDPLYQDTLSNNQNKKQIILEIKNNQNYYINQSRQNDETSSDNVDSEIGSDIYDRIEEALKRGFDSGLNNEKFSKNEEQNGEYFEEFSEESSENTYPNTYQLLNEIRSSILPHLSKNLPTDIDQDTSQSLNHPNSIRNSPPHAYSLSSQERYSSPSLFKDEKKFSPEPLTKKVQNEFIQSSIESNYDFKTENQASKNLKSNEIDNIVSNVTNGIEKLPEFNELEFGKYPTKSYKELEEEFYKSRNDNKLIQSSTVSPSKYRSIESIPSHKRIVSEVRKQPITIMESSLTYKKEMEQIQKSITHPSSNRIYSSTPKSLNSSKSTHQSLEKVSSPESLRQSSRYFSPPKNPSERRISLSESTISSEYVLPTKTQSPSRRQIRTSSTSGKRESESPLRYRPLHESLPRRTVGSPSKIRGSIMTPRTHYYDRLHRIRRVLATPKYMIKGNLGVSPYTKELLGDALVSNFELLDRRKKINKKYTNVYLPPYQPTGKYEEPQSFLKDQLKSKNNTSVDDQLNQYEKRKEYGKKVWGDRVKLVNNKYQKLKRAQNVVELDRLRQEWILLSQWMSDLNPNQKLDLPDSNTASLADELEQLGNQLWPDPDKRPQPHILSTESHHLVNQSLNEIEKEENLERKKTILSPIKTSQFSEKNQEPYSPGRSNEADISISANELLQQARSVLLRTSELFKDVSKSLESSPVQQENDLNSTAKSYTTSLSLNNSKIESKSTDKIVLQFPQERDETLEDQSNTSSTSDLTDSLFIPHEEDYIKQETISQEEEEFIQFPPLNRESLPYLFSFFPVEIVHLIFSLVSKQWYDAVHDLKTWTFLFKSRYGIQLANPVDTINQFKRHIKFQNQFSLQGINRKLTDPTYPLQSYPESQFSKDVLSKLYHLNVLDQARCSMMKRAETFLNNWSNSTPFSVLAKELFSEPSLFADQKNEFSILDSQEPYAEIIFINKSKELESRIKDAEDQLHKAKMLAASHPQSKAAKNRSQILKNIPQQESQIKKLIKKLEKEATDVDKERYIFKLDVPFYKKHLHSKWKNFIEQRRNYFNIFTIDHNILVTRFESDVKLDDTFSLDIANFNAEVILFGSRGDYITVTFSNKTQQSSLSKTGVIQEFEFILKHDEENFFSLFDSNGQIIESSAQQLCEVILGDKFDPDDEVQPIGTVWFLLTMLMPTQVSSRIPNEEIIFQLYRKSMNYNINFIPLNFTPTRTVSRPISSKIVSWMDQTQNIKELVHQNESLSFERKDSNLSNIYEKNINDYITNNSSHYPHKENSKFSEFTPNIIYCICGFLSYESLVPGGLLLNKAWYSILNLITPQNLEDIQEQKFWTRMIANEIGVPFDFIKKDPKESFKQLWKSIVTYRFIPFYHLKSPIVGTQIFSNKIAITLCENQLKDRLELFLKNPESLIKFFQLQIESPPNSDVDVKSVWDSYLQKHHHQYFVKYFVKNSKTLFLKDIKMHIAPKKATPGKIEFVSYVTFVVLRYRGIELHIKLVCEYHPSRKRADPTNFKIEYRGGQDAAQHFFDNFLTHELKVPVQPVILQNSQNQSIQNQSFKSPDRLHISTSGKAISSSTSKKSKSADSHINYSQFLQIILRYVLMPFDYVQQVDGLDESKCFDFVKIMHRDHILNMICNFYNTEHNLPYFKSVRPSQNK